MARWSSSAEIVEPIAGWAMAITPAGSAATPGELADNLEWFAAAVPGTAVGALAADGRWSFDKPVPLHDNDVWCRASIQGQGCEILRFDGLATLAEVWLDNERILVSDNMFLAHAVEATLSGAHTLTIAFRANAARASASRPRPRWRSAMIAGDGLRHLRTTLLGHMPGWCPPVDVVGPWRPISRIRRTCDLHIRLVDLRAEPIGEGGVVRISLDLAGDLQGSPAVLVCAGAESPLRRASSGRLEGELHLANVDPWMPNGYGAQPLYSVRARIGETVLDLGRVGFRAIAVDSGPDRKGFGLVVNGRPVFCRGACWTPLDVLMLNASPEALRDALTQLRDAGFTMLRISGVTVYETDAFYAFCDELGLLVWQDFMFANLDYPVADAAFAAGVAEEARQFLLRTQASPCLAVLCGGSEIAQQAAMLGYPPEAWSGPLTGEILPAAVAALRPDVPYVEGSPWGGDLPFAANEGVTHYYGVGAYRRPLEDARRAHVRFASECLAFANVPEPVTLDRHLPVPAVHDPRWKARTPRDVGAAWDFEDVRDHYLGLLFGVDPARLRTEDPERFLALSRATTAEVMEATFAEWRRPGSPTRGGLVWFLRDLWPGAGWGVIDATGEPKSAFWALKRAFRPVQLTMTDEGVNGLTLHLANDTPRPVEAVLSFSCLREGATPVARGERLVLLPPGSGQTLGSAALLGSFFDVTYAYRFGPPAHDVCVATLADAATGRVLADAFHFPQGRGATRVPVALSVQVDRDREGWSLLVAADRFAQSVHVIDEAFCPDENWFHLPPGRDKRIRLTPRSAGDATPAGRVAAVNAVASFPYRTA
ncbi:beta-mannosidase [Alsobacter metallidurans]|uniref:beta-mannosidase n=1 Tax=Alsobacter metallidurans TaxID=340221 RepID=A0A917I3F7_9HYPH|nr:glycoside hydrolase family 2 protein [Alsobacter metallidurans]GGH10170.1 beta-mannosidase [Alsobacter metallidurans]